MALPSTSRDALNHLVIEWFRRNMCLKKMRKHVICHHRQASESALVKCLGVSRPDVHQKRRFSDRIESLMRFAMQQSTEIDSNFMKLAAPVLAEFGFDNTKELVREQLILMLSSRISRYDSEIKILEKKYGGAYEELKYRQQSQEEKFDLEDDLNDWRFAIEAVRRCREKLQEIENA
jgi:exonuclease VII small subunit